MISKHLDTNSPRSAAAGDSLYNVDQIRRQASKSLLEGALTENYPLDVEKACALLNEALATEILCVLRYRHHQVIAKGISSSDIAKEFAEHAANEEEHMIMIAERINQLGGDPDMNPATVASRAVTEYGHGKDLVTLIREDLVAERIVIDVYRKLVGWFGLEDPTTRRMLEKILKDEEEHANELADLLVANEDRQERDAH
ncbi:MAG: ferritin-like domain-containing protein [Bdellovibrio sp.]|nr:ferritin-like domain-containing protein [Bdellovibrio sp.]